MSLEQQQWDDWQAEKARRAAPGSRGYNLTPWADDVTERNLAANLAAVNARAAAQPVALGDPRQMPPMSGANPARVPGLLNPVMTSGGSAFQNGPSPVALGDPRQTPPTPGVVQNGAPGQMPMSLPSPHLAPPQPSSIASPAVKPQLNASDVSAGTGASGAGGTGNSYAEPGRNQIRPNALKSLAAATGSNGRY